MAIGAQRVLEGYRILIVDDDQDNAEFLMFFLEGYGAIVKPCLSGREALTIVAEWHPHVLISDIAMPEMDGCRLIEQVRAHQVEHDELVWAIAVSAMVREEDRQRSLDAGFDYYFPKPLNLDALINLLAALGKK